MTKAESEMLRVAAGILGRIKTPKKAASSRANGKLGGRPKKLSKPLPKQKQD